MFLPKVKTFLRKPWKGIMDIEREFEITIPDNMTEKIVTVGDAIKVVEEIKGK